MVGPPRREAVRPAPLAACGWWRPRADGTSLVVVGTGAHKRTLQASPALACREAIFGLTRARLWGHRVCGLELPVPGQPRRARQREHRGGRGLRRPRSSCLRQFGFLAARTQIMRVQRPPAAIRKNITIAVGAGISRPPGGCTTSEGERTTAHTVLM